MRFLVSMHSGSVASSEDGYFLLASDATFWYSSLALLPAFDFLGDSRRIARSMDFASNAFSNTDTFVCLRGDALSLLFCAVVIEFNMVDAALWSDWCVCSSDPLRWF